MMKRCVGVAAISTGGFVWVCALATSLKFNALLLFLLVLTRGSGFVQLCDVKKSF